ncbi:amino acid ABC transporter permease [Mesorhizobium sp. M3A.F.Ca.ET.201.01.1.1]|uniref:amino acid ABC transporter permease n=1 Tax=Mesorhizobium sp. M3A.F.Ca.ET.201.01.1.1 TaxID=2563946 RepID=UPI00109379B5|nr:amino acid ABC transporter permease [Mesorhizobium sp. M3A.F.Ca.ET.201.01.1.1]TGS71754.1 amino acid ABC transporter permease [Mesorhizobium sp. M3A.F.Ca.ET.201.01.1.1]
MTLYHFNFSFIWKHFDKLAGGWVVSLELAGFAVLFGMALGLGLAVAYNASGRAVRSSIVAYVELFRNVPLLLLVYVAFYGLPSLGLRGLDAWTTFALTLTVYASAQFVEVFRAGLDSVPLGLSEAGRALGLRHWQNFAFVILPLTMRASLPAIGNLVVSFFKETSIASAIAVPELTYGAQWINLNSFRVLEVYAVVTPMYLATSYGLTLLLLRTERALRRPG